MSRVLYQFPLSHYSEKARWLLDAKGLDYQRRSLVPGPHRFTSLRLAGIATLPVLRDGAVCTGDSSAIALYLERQYPSPVLLPSDPDRRARVLQLEAFADHLGEHVRRCVWSLAVDEPWVDRLFFDFDTYSGGVRRGGRWWRPLLRQMIRRRFNVYPEPVAESWKILSASMDLLATRLEHDPARYLVGDGFTLADLTMACMLAPLIGPPESPWTDAHVTPAEEAPGAAGVADSGRAIWRDQVVGQWVMRIYRVHRH